MRRIAASLAVLAVLCACGADGLPRGDDPVTLDPQSVGPQVTNKWHPLEPGTRWTYRETTPEGDTLDVVVTATSATRKIANGVTARVVRDTVRHNGAIIEDTFDWYAQDADGNVWYLGEDTAEFENGKITTREGSFEAGVDGALPGIIMAADPQPDLAYRQEFYAGHAEDNGKVLRLNASATVPYGRFDHLLVTEDTNALEPKAREHKYFAAGVGLVLTIDKAEGGREELIAVEQISAAEARLAASAPLGADY